MPTVIGVGALLVGAVVTFAMLRHVSRAGLAGTWLVSVVAFAVASQGLALTWAGPISAGIGVGLAGVLWLRFAVLRQMRSTVTAIVESPKGQETIGRSRMLKRLRARRRE
jgi:hypothetical protein